MRPRYQYLYEYDIITNVFLATNPKILAGRTKSRETRPRYRFFRI